MTASCVYLWILKHLFYRALLRNCLFHVQVAEFKTADTVKNYFTGAFQAFSTRTRSSHPKAFIYLKFLKIICEEVNSWWSCEMLTCKFTKKNSFTYLPSWILLLFSKIAWPLFFPKRLWKCTSKISFGKYKQKVVLLIIYLFNYYWSKSTSFMFNVAYDVVWVRVLSNKLGFIAILRLQKHSFFLGLCVLIYNR